MERFITVISNNGSRYTVPLYTFTVFMFCFALFIPRSRSPLLRRHPSDRMFNWMNGAHGLYALWCAIPTIILRWLTPVDEHKYTKSMEIECGTIYSNRHCCVALVCGGFESRWQLSMQCILMSTMQICMHCTCTHNDGDDSSPAVWHTQFNVYSRNNRRSHLIFFERKINE